MTTNRVRGVALGMSALGFAWITFNEWGGNGPLVVMSLMGAGVSFFVSLKLLLPKKMVQSFEKPLPSNSMSYAEEERTYSKEAEMVRAAQLRYGIRTVDRFNLLEIAGEVVREAVTAERKLWMKESKKRGLR